MHGSKKSLYREMKPMNWNKSQILSDEPR